MKRLMLLLTVSVVGLASTKSYAGWQFTPGAYCTKLSDGSGYCNGSMIGFRNATDPSAYAYFGLSYSSGSLSGSFSAYLNGVYYSCTAAPAMYQPLSTSIGNGLTAVPLPIWQQALTPQATFMIQWNSSGGCYYLSVGQTSLYGWSY